MDIVTESELVEILSVSTAKVTILKKNGDERTLNCTMQVPDSYAPKSKTPREKKPGLFVVWDVDHQQFRSFNFNQVLSVSVGENA